MISRFKKAPQTKLKYISKERKKEVDQVFQTLGLKYQKYFYAYSPPHEDYSMPFKQFSILKTRGLVFKTTSTCI